MKWYKCLVEGKNFPGVLINESKVIGFHATRYVEANTVDEAQMLVLSMVRNEEKLKLPAGIKPPGDAIISFNEITEIDEKDVLAEQSGLTFYVMEP